MEDPAVEGLKRENDAMRKHFQDLQEEVDDKQRALQEERENRVSAVREAKEEERAKIRAEMEESKQKMTSDHLREMDAVREDIMLKAKHEMTIYQQMKDKEVEDKLRQFKEKAEPQITLEQKVAKATEELAAKHEAQIKKLHAAMFELESARDDMKRRLENAVVADREKAEEIRRLRDEHEKKMRKASQDSRTDNKKQVEEVKEFQRRLSVKDRELITIQEKYAHVEMEKEQLEDKLKRIKAAESWEKMSPRSSITGEPFSPFGRKYSDHEKDVMVRNSELSYLARSLQDKNKMLEEEKKQCLERAEKAELLNKPLQDKIEKLMKKIDHFTASKSTMERKMDTLSRENVDLRSSRQKLEGEVERQKRTFQRQLMEARTRSTSVTQLKGDLLALNTKLEELTKENQKLKEVNQRRTKDLGRLRKELAGVKRQHNSLAEQSLSDTPPSPFLPKDDDEDEEGSGSVPSLTEGDEQSDGRVEEPVTQASPAALEQDKQQEPESISAQEEPKVEGQSGVGDASKVEELQARVDELEYFIIEQDELKKRIKEKYEQEAEQARQELATLKDELQQHEQEAAQARQEQAALKDELQQYEQEAAQARQEQAALKDELQQHQQEAEQARQEQAALKDELQQHQQEAEQARQEQAALRDELQQHEQEAEQARQEQAALKDELQQHQQEAEQARQEQAALRDELQQYEQEAEQARQEQAALKNELQQYEQEAEQAKQEQAALKDELQQYEQEAEQARQEQAALKDELQQYEQEAEQARQEQAALRDELQQRTMELEAAADGGSREEHGSELQKESEADELKAQLSALQDTVAEREATLERFQKLIVVLKAKLHEASGGSSPSSYFPEPHQLESYISDLEDSETKLREIYEELLHKPLFLAKENQRLEEELQEARETEEELTEEINQVEEKLNTVEAEKEEREEELRKLQKWLDDNQPALVELEHLKDDLDTARSRIADLEQMQEELLNKAEEAASSEVPPALSSKPQSRRAGRRESEVMRQSGTKVIERSITVVEHVQATVLELREKMLLSGVLKDNGAHTPEEVPARVQKQEMGADGTGESGDETKVEVQETAQIDIGTEMSNLTEQLAQELQNLKQIKDDVTDGNSPQAEGNPPLHEIIEVSVTTTADFGILGSGLPSDGISDTNENVEAKSPEMASASECPSEYETPQATAKRQRGTSIPSGADLEHDYAEIADKQHRVSGVYEPVEIRDRARRDADATAGEVEVEPVIEEEPKLVWSAPPDFESFKKELEELRETVHEKEEQLKSSEDREQKLVEELAAIAPENERMKAKLSELEEREANMTETVTTYEGQLRDYQHCLSELNDKIGSADVEKQLLESNKFDLETKLGEKEELLRDCSHLVPVLHKKIEKLEAEGETWKNRYNTLLEQMPEMTDGGDKERTEELERELETWKERFEELSQKAASVNKELLAKLQSQTAYLQRELDQRAEEIVQLRAQLNPADRDLAKERSVRGSRVFVALFDYEPSILCHTGHPEKELEFMEGDILEVTGEMDESGFYHAALNSSAGLVPVNFVEEVDVRDQSARSRLYNQRLGPVEVNSRNLASPISLIEEVVDEGEEFPISFTAFESGASPDGPTSFSVALGNKPQTPRQVKVVDAFPNGITVSWQPPPDYRHGNSQISGYLIAVGDSEERHIPGHSTSMVNIPNVNYAELSSLRLCSVTKEGAQSDWVTVSVGHETIPFPAQLQGPPLSGSYAQGSLYDSLKLGQSAGSPMNSFQDGVAGVPTSSDPVSAATMVSSHLSSGEGELYVALYDYDPQTSSPNDEPSDELSLTTGDTVTVLEDVRDDGFVKAELKGKVGLVPFSFLEKATIGMVKAKKVATPLPDPEISAPTEKQPKQKMVALYDYDPSVQSPNMDKETELAFRKGQLITVCGPTDRFGFFMGEIGGKQGLVPSNFVKAVLA